MEILLPQTIEIFDSTLRDGAQGEGISFSLEDKLAITRLLDSMGISFLEAGNPGSNPKDLEYFGRVTDDPPRHTRIVAFGSTRRKDSSAAEDSGVRALLQCGAKTACIFGKASELHVREILRTTREENVAMIEDTVGFLRGHGMDVFFDAEHFFDGYRANPECALEALSAAARGGASRLILCDTNGGTFPSDIYEITARVVERFPGLIIGIHCHNDCGMAVAGSIAAAEAGASHIQGTFLGFGERCGNANLCTILANLQLKKGCSCIPPECLPMLTASARELAEIANVSLRRYEPYVGSSAFAHKAGMHADGVLKNSHSFEHVSPESVGNERRFLMSEQAGRTALVHKLHRAFPQLQKDSPQAAAILDHLKELEQQGYQFEGADGSFELMIRRQLGLYRPSFELISYKVLDEEPADNTNNSATATLKIRVDGTLKIAAAEGDGPVHALDLALREALCSFYPSLSKCRLFDYKVRVMDTGGATASRVRVLIASTDGKDIWTTVGVAEDIIRASWLALVDSLEYRLIHPSGRMPDASGPA